VNVASALTLLRELAGSIRTADIEIGSSRLPPHDYAFMKMSSPTNPDSFAIVSTPGDRWFTLEVSGGFAHNEFSEFNDDQEVRQILERYVRGGLTYLAGGGSNAVSRVFRIPYVTVPTEEGQLRLGLSVPAELRHLFRGAAKR
jgi:hypothetical protein